MVNFEIPSSHTLSASEGTPHLTINREATIDLDSSNAFEGPEKLLEVWFAPAPNALPPGARKNGLKAVTSEKWTEMLDQVNCKILSVVDSEHVDAYLLSESSMFVFPHKLILKTCGTTTLLFGLHRLLEIAAVDVGFPSHNSASAKTKAAATPYRVFYSRKNFLFPDKQHGPHRSWKEEVKYLDHMFTGGSAYMVGKMNGDHWYLYLTTPNTTLTPPRTPENQIAGTETKVLQVPFSSGLEAGEGALGTVDETLEVLMTDLNPENAKQFYLEHASAVAEEKYSKRAKEARREAVETLGNLNGDSMANSCMSLSGTTNGSTSGHDETFDVFSNTSSDHGAYTPDNDVDFPEDLNTEGHSLGTVVSEACGISEVYPTSRYPDARVDAYLFTPCGFSANGVIPAPDQAGTATHYFTVHVTPEPQCSYASFETNVPGGKCGRETVEVIEHVVNIFKPGRFSVTLFEAKADSAEKRDAVVDAKAAEMGRIRSAKMEKIRGYRRVERIVHDFDGYELVFRYYERNDWDGLAGPRLGEMDG